MTEVVYFILADADPKCIKIGHTKRPIKLRMSVLQSWSPYNLSLIGIIPGGRSLEAQIHQRFAKHYKCGEWFNAADELMQFIKKQCPNFEWVSGLERIGVTRNSRHNPITEGKRGSISDIKEVLELYNSGLTLQDIGNKFNVTRERVRQFLNIHGVNTKRRCPSQDSEEINIIEDSDTGMYNFKTWLKEMQKEIDENGVVLEAVCKRANIKSQTVRNWRKTPPNTIQMMQRFEKAIREEKASMERLRDK